MVVRRTYIRLWEIIFFFDFDADDKERIIHALVGAGAPVSIVSRVSRSIDDGKLNEGFTYSNPKLRQSVVGIGKTSSGPEFMNSTVHEIVHLAQDIAIAYKISLGGEEIAYLAGDISRSVSEVVCELSCPHCRLQ